MAATKSIPEQVPNLPALDPPPGATPNFINPPDLTTDFYIDLVLCLIISSLAVCMRVWTKARLIQKVGREDCKEFSTRPVKFSNYRADQFQGSAYSLSYELSALSRALFGVGVHQWNINLESLSRYLYHIRVATALYGSVICTIKIAILLEFLRIFSPGSRHITFWIYHFLIWLNFLFYVVISFFVIFPCQPIEKSWKPWIVGRCMNALTINVVTASFNSASNLSILILPQKVIWNLQMSFKKKVGVSAIFLAGVLACFSSLNLLYYSVRLSKSKDITYNVGLLGLWTLAEMTSGFLAICLTVSPRFFQSLKHVARPSWISISRPHQDRSLKTANYLSQFNSSTRLPKISTLSRAKQTSPSTKRSAGLMSGDPAPIGGSSLSKLEPGSSHILRCIEISTTNEPIDASTPIYPTDW